MVTAVVQVLLMVQVLVEVVLILREEMHSKVLVVHRFYLAELEVVVGEHQVPISLVVMVVLVEEVEGGVMFKPGEEEEEVIRADKVVTETTLTVEEVVVVLSIMELQQLT